MKINSPSTVLPYVSTPLHAHPILLRHTKTLPAKKFVPFWYPIQAQNKNFLASSGIAVQTNKLTRNLTKIAFKTLVYNVMIISIFLQSFNIPNYK